MKFFEIAISTAHNMTEIVADILMELGSEGVNIRDKTDLAELLESPGKWDYVSRELFDSFPERALVSGCYRKNIIKQITKRLNGLKKIFEDFEYGISVSERQEEDYLNEWKKYFVPIVAGNLAVVPVWQEYKTDKPKILIDPGLAFGTGTHETTRLCLELLQKVLNGGETVIDIGCGSGILGIAALKLGADKCYLIDIDPCAANAAKANLAVNGFGELQAVVLTGDLVSDLDIKADVIIANITADILLRLSDGLKSRCAPSAKIILSGILDVRLDDVRDFYTVNGYRILESAALGEWCGLLLECQ